MTSPPDRVRVVDTVLGAVAPPGPGRTGNVVHTVPTHAGPDALIARGCLHANDGGGGLFVWQPSSAAADDGGTVLLPNTHVPAPNIQPVNGRWHRVYSGALDIRWFGAQGGEDIDDTQAIQNAIYAVSRPKVANAVANAPAARAEIFVPGAFRAHVLLPRLGVNDSGLTIRGAGIHTSEIVWNGVEPVVDFDGPDTEYAMNYRFMSIMFRHLALGGTAFRHVTSGAGRLLYATFEDVGFFSLGVHVDANGQPNGNAPVAELRAMFNSRLERVWFSGSAGILITGSRNCLTAVKTFQDGQQTDGIVLAPCSETVIDVPRIDGLRGNGGDGIRLVDSSNITLRNTSFEGKNGRSCIRIENSSNIMLDNCNMGGAPAANVEYAALWITGNSKNIRIDGGLINVFDIAGIRIDAGSRSVRGKAIEFGQSSGAAMTTFLNVDPAAADIRIETFTGTDAGVEFAQTVGKALFRGTTLLLQRWEDLRVTGIHTIENIAQGDDGDGPSFGSASAGRRVTLFLSGGAVTVASGLPSAIRLSSGVAWTPPGDAMLDIVFDGALWWEVARNG